MKIGKYEVMFVAPLRNVKSWLRGEPYRIPFIVNTGQFTTVPQPDRYFIVEQDGIGGQWFAHDNHFINIVESNEVCFADTPQAALIDYMHEYGNLVRPKEEQ